MYQANRLRVLMLYADQAGVHVPPGELPEVLGPYLLELEAQHWSELRADDHALLLSYLSQRLLGEPWPEALSPPQRADFLGRLQAAAFEKRWDVDTERVVTAYESEWGMDIWRSLRAAIRESLPDGQQVRRALGVPEREGGRGPDRTEEVLRWYAEASGVVLSERDLERLPAMSRTLHLVYQVYGLEHDTPEFALMRAHELALWLLDEGWPETMDEETNRRFVARLQRAAAAKGLTTAPWRWRWSVVAAFQEAAHE